MQVFEMAALIAVVAIVAGVIKEWLTRKAADAVDLSGIETRLSQLENLQQRIETLEAIVTDKGYDLKREIEGL